MARIGKKPASDFEINERPDDFEDKGSGIATSNKKMFIIMIALLVVLATLFVLETTGVISLLVFDIILAPIVVVAIIFYLKSRGR